MTINMKSFDEFIKLSDESLRQLFEKQKIYIPKKISHNDLLDYAINKLHGIEFIHNNEKEIKGKITLILPTPKPVPGEQCPSCKQKTLRKLKVPDTNTYSGYTHCSYCGLYLSPEEQKDYNKKPEVKA